MRPPLLRGLPSLNRRHRMSSRRVLPSEVRRWTWSRVHVASEASNGDRVEGRIGLPITALIESTPVDGSRLTCFDGADAAARCEGDLTGEPLGVVAGGEQQRCGAVRPEVVVVHQLRHVSVDGCGDLGHTSRSTNVQQCRPSRSMNRPGRFADLRVRELSDLSSRGLRTRPAAGNCSPRT